MRRRRDLTCLAAILVIGAAVAAPTRGTAETSAAPSPLRVCADPDDLPFSSAKAETPGLYIEIGQQIARTLGRPLEPVWALSYFGKRTVRTTLLAKTCDAYIGLPGGKGFMGPQLIHSKPFMQAGFAVMAPADTPIARMDDLAGKRVGVQFSTPPQIALATRDDIKSVTFLNPDEAAHALDRHEVDVAFIWGPTAGYINATALHGAYQVVPVAGQGMQYSVSIGFTKGNAELRDQVDRALETDSAAIDQLVKKYGVPTAKPIDFASLLTVSAPTIVLAATSETATAPPAAIATDQAAAKPANPSGSPSGAPSGVDGGSDQIAAGKQIFNGTCSHCHGPDAVQSDKHIDLRLLHRRYGDTTESVFYQTVTNGRPSKGMPKWSGIFSQEDFKKIYAYLSSVQTK